MKQEGRLKSKTTESQNSENESEEEDQVATKYRVTKERVFMMSESRNR